MKWMFLIFAWTLVLFACWKVEKDPVRLPITRCDSLQVKNTTLVRKNDSLRDKLGIMTGKYDSTHTEAVQCRFRINRVKYYMKIVDKRPSQQKFLRGWIKRAIED